MIEITAYKTTDGTIFENEEAAIDHQEGLQAYAFLQLINASLPERERNCLSSNDWFRVQQNVVLNLRKENSSVRNAINRLVEVI